ncbi:MULTISPECIES: hypothetical protein [unclassified Bosea (in: a-proteobacteria)]|uniref:hypothetical protein n=1 Tax=unclassified Bosea (in: a-proteobacteria) TaxID=2653178 RepID=UPI000F7DAD66|nr:MULTISPECIES: hypothetical protein [unclassified Bosea (in: a-proteobacteria)]
MRGAKPGHVSSLAAYLFIAFAASATAADVPNRKGVPFVIDPFAPSAEQPLRITRPSRADWFYTGTFWSGFGPVTHHGLATIKDVEQFDGSEPRPIPKFPPLSLTIP